MAKHHGAKDQKRTAKQKAKRLAKRLALLYRTSNDPTVRLRSAADWPVTQALVGDRLWKQGIGHALIARREPDGGLVFAVFLVDVYCLGVKNAFWRPGTSADIRDLTGRIADSETMAEIDPACLSKIVKGAVEYAQSFGFPPHPDYRHAAMLLDGIDPSTCPREFTFGKDGRPYYIQGPNESTAVAAAIMKIVEKAGGHFIVAMSGEEANRHSRSGRKFDPSSLHDEESFSDDLP